MIANDQIQKNIACTLYDSAKLKGTAKEIAQQTREYEEAAPMSEEQVIVESIVTAIVGRNAILNFGAKSSGVIPLVEFKDHPNLKIGDKVEIYVKQQEDMHGELIVSRKSVRLIKTWETFCEAKTIGKVLKGYVVREIKGGLVLEIFGMEVFMPRSHINTVRTNNLEEYVGTYMEVLVAKISEKKDNIVVSRKNLIEQRQAKQKEAIINSLEIGQVLRNCVIKNVTSFGLFVDLGGIVGLLHKKDMTWYGNDDPIKAVDAAGIPCFKLGQSIDVVVKDFDLKKNQTALSTKMLAWSYLPEDLEKGARVKGVVKAVTNYYALLEISGVMGLLTISDMSHSNCVKNAEEIVSMGQEMEVAIIDIDRANQKLRVGLKQLLPNPWEGDVAAKYAVNTRHKAQVFSIIKHGIYLELEAGIQGFLHSKHFSWLKIIHDPSVLFKEKQEVEVLVLDIDQENKLLYLGLRELEENPWAQFKKTFVVGSKHQGKILKITSGGVWVELPHGLEVFVSTKVFDKAIKTVAVEDVLDFYVTAFLEQEQKILLSRSAKVEAKVAPTYTFKESNKTLGDFEVLKQLKAELAETDRLEKQKPDMSKK